MKIEVSKIDAKDEKLLAGAEFGLYAKEDLLNEKGITVVKADTLFATAESTDVEIVVKNAVFDVKLPHGRYYVKELKAPDGYVCSEECYEVEAFYTNQEEKVMEKRMTVKNEKATEKPTEKPAEKPAVVPQAPKTGDSAQTALWGNTLGAAFLGFVLLKRKKQR